ncbi:N-acetylmuramoyl-L-alanine amidase [Proteinivorax tanatarense]|uniref:N-acetylmuramoyl-L-alanine amidase n=1 Tax=Proteinivorax tanatarense TaxID=1260629 RepID=A0AAU7VI41_9FIRM
MGVTTNLKQLTRRYMKNNDCYKAGRKIKPKGIMVHSTATPGVMAASWFSRWNRSYKKGEINRQVCIHAFLDDKEVWQYLPWDHRGWHAGGAANNTHIGFEICEPAGFSYSGATMVGYDVQKHEEYFRKAWKNAVELCVMLCLKYDLTEKDIIGHSEGHQKGIASNHADVGHWLPKHGESMDTFRLAVKEALQKEGGDNLQPVAIKVGDVVKIKESTSRYYPGGPRIPNWVKDTYHKVTQIKSGGNLVIRGGKSCVLLGKKVDKNSKEESKGIMTWADIDGLTNLSARPKEDKASKGSGKKLYRVQAGAFSKKENADKLLKRLKSAGFDAYIRRD